MRRKKTGIRWSNKEDTRRSGFRYITQTERPKEDNLDKLAEEVTKSEFRVDEHTGDGRDEENQPSKQQKTSISHQQREKSRGGGKISLSYLSTQDHFCRRRCA
uniref:Uncharacterized protein n=1 Tax=Trichobilharzia regenti TaxID=157069 RepID=A0AA85K8H1_TRIRE|nr:unnamed protein product [Trichobilharzia regenti]